MSLDKVAIKNERPGTMTTPALRPPEESDFVAPSEDRQTSAKK
jgi:hypothetical protein